MSSILIDPNLDTFGMKPFHGNEKVDVSQVTAGFRRSSSKGRGVREKVTKYVFTSVHL